MVNMFGTRLLPSLICLALLLVVVTNCSKSDTLVIENVDYRRVTEMPDFPILNVGHAEFSSCLGLLSDDRAGLIHVVRMPAATVFDILSPDPFQLIDSISPKLAVLYPDIQFFSIADFLEFTRTDSASIVGGMFMKPRYKVATFRDTNSVAILTSSYVPYLAEPGRVVGMRPVISIVNYCLSTNEVESIILLDGYENTTWPVSCALTVIDPEHYVVSVENSRLLTSTAATGPPILPAFSLFNAAGTQQSSQLSHHEDNVRLYGYGMTMNQPFINQNGLLVYTYAAVPFFTFADPDCSNSAFYNYFSVFDHIEGGKAILDTLGRYLQSNIYLPAGSNPYVCTGFVPVKSLFVGVIRQWKNATGRPSAYVPVMSLGRSDTLKFETFVESRHKAKVLPWRTAQERFTNKRSVFYVLGRSVPSGDWYIEQYSVD